MKLVKLDDDVWVNPEHVVSVEREPHGTSVCMLNEASHFVALDVYEVLDRLDPVRAEAGAFAEQARNWREWAP